MSSNKISIEMNRNEDASYTVAFSKRGDKYFDGLSDITNPAEAATEAGQFVTEWLMQNLEVISGVSQEPPTHI